MSEHIARKGPSPRIRLSSLSPLALIVVCAIIVAGLTVSARAWLSPAMKTEPFVPLPEVQAALPSLPQGNSARERVEAEVITILPTGFNPSEITRPKGRFLVIVDNRSGLEEVNLRLDREDGNRMHEARSQRKPDWREAFDLPPGRYLLKAANNPDWVCRITVTAQ